MGTPFGQLPNLVATQHIAHCETKSEQIKIKFKRCKDAGT
jgi:hypothetical protein